MIFHVSINLLAKGFRFRRGTQNRNFETVQLAAVTIQLLYHHFSYSLFVLCFCLSSPLFVYSVAGIFALLSASIFTGQIFWREIYNRRCRWNWGATNKIVKMELYASWMAKVNKSNVPRHHANLKMIYCVTGSEWKLVFSASDGACSIREQIPGWIFSLFVSLSQMNMCKNCEVMCLLSCNENKNKEPLLMECLNDVRFRMNIKQRSGVEISFERSITKQPTNC